MGHMGRRKKSSQGFKANQADIVAMVIPDQTGNYTLQKVSGANVDVSVPTASLAKMMTGYLVFEALSDGRLKLDERIPIPKEVKDLKYSNFSKLPNNVDSVLVGEAIVGMALQSNNYLTYALAKKVGGTEKNFVEMMNNKAKDMGLDHTVFLSSTGLPVTVNGRKKDSLSTLSELSRLAVSLHTDFPEYEYLLRQTEAKIDGTPLRIPPNSPVHLDLPGYAGGKTGTLNNRCKSSVVAVFDKDGDGMPDGVAGVMCAPNALKRNELLIQKSDMFAPKVEPAPVPSDQSGRKTSYIPTPSSTL